MSNYQIITDSCCDFTEAMYKEQDVIYAPLSVLYKGVNHDNFTDDASLKELYNGLAAGETASTSAANPETWVRVIKPSLDAGKDVLVMAFSSGLSTTYQSAVIAAEELREVYPDRKINVVDTLCAALGQGLLVWYACRKRNEGLSLDELTEWVENNKLHLCHWFTVDDLMYLKRGGRVSATTALVGTMLNIKPVLHVDDEGHLINVAKTRGRKASLDALAKKLGELGDGYDNSTVFISHGNCLEDAEYLARVVKEKYGVKEVVIGYVGAVIGAHAGPGVVAFFFMGSKR
ncbi:MAG: DegV family protein [Oscillospiraceae bacterium]|nr:DegV family protein [Oscillospiraceae bacterium]